MADWFRNTEWNDEIAVGFDARLSRARDRAQYLNIQAYALLATHPSVAADLLRRAIALDDPAQTARAGLYLGTALAAAGDLDGAIAALEEAIAAERRHPSHRTGAHIDQPLLIALAQRRDLYDRALERIAGEQQLPALIAATLIRGERGEAVAAAAEAALAGLDGAEGEASPLPDGLTIAALKRRLEALAAGARTSRPT